MVAYQAKNPKRNIRTQKMSLGKKVEMNSRRIIPILVLYIFFIIFFIKRLKKLKGNHGQQ